MRVLLSTIGSRGDVQPLVALALELEALGHAVHFCAPPDFRHWIAGYGFETTPIGPEVRGTAAAKVPAAPPAPPSPEVLRRIAEATVATQFETLPVAAQGCDVILGSTALQIGTRSVAEQLGIPYVFAAYCPIVLPSAHHAPPLLTTRGDTPAAADADNEALWAADARRWNVTWADALNAHRKAAGLPAVDDVRAHLLTDGPWLAADPALAPWPDPDKCPVFQPGAWIVPDERALPAEVEAFLEA